MTATANPMAPHDAAPLPLLGRRRKRSRRGLWVLVIVIALAGAGWFVARRWTGGDSAPSYVATPAARADVVVQVTATGTLAPVVTVAVGSQISGRVSELHADYNTMVKRGDVLARIDPRLFESAVAQAKARLSSAHADYERAKAMAENAASQNERAKALAASGTLARAEAEAAVANLRAANAQVSAASSAITLARAGLDQAKTNLAYTTITSPIDGIVVSRSVDVGQTVAASLSAPTLFVIAEDLRNMEVHTSVAESDVGQLSSGMEVEFTVDAFPDVTFRGDVKQVRYEAVNVSNVVTYDAVVAVRNEDLGLRPGMTANVRFIVEARRDVLAVPNKALMYRPADARERLAAAGLDSRARSGRRGRRTVWVLRDGEPVPVRVTLGITDGTNTEVVVGDSGGLAEGDLIITGDGTGNGSRRPEGGQQGGRRRGPPRVL